MAQSPLRLGGALTTRTVAGQKWARNLSVYEANLDRYGFAKGAALREFAAHLPVLKTMGVGIVWFMPLHPRGFKRGFGSAYSVRDYTEINPDLGTKDDFRRLVNRAHALGLRVLMDWVPNHTAWENPLTESHPQFYARNAAGEIVQAGPWADVAQLDYGSPGAWNTPLWERQRTDMSYWLREFGVDGFRCDVAGRAGKVPREFWTWLRPRLDAVHPVFMLAEADDPYLHPAFDMTYSWNLPPVLWDICAGRKPATAIDDALAQEARDYPPGAIRMRFLDNHDWHNHADWGWGDKPPLPNTPGMPQVAPLMVLCATLPGKPLLYNGQEMAFMKTDPPKIATDRQKSPVWKFYSRLLSLYRDSPALSGGALARLPTPDDRIYAFVRGTGAKRVLIAVNLSGEERTARLQGDVSGKWRGWFGGGTLMFPPELSVNLEAWGYRVYVPA
ncbi:MAG: hypothetical protein H7Y38_08720 [Armatimonadetes bacterium]|nr:hypothetical protein [Armatimonadota bacterium]